MDAQCSTFNTEAPSHQGKLFGHQKIINNFFAQRLHVGRYLGRFIRAWRGVAYVSAFSKTTQQFLGLFT